MQVIQYAVEVDAECSCFPLEWLFHFRWGKKTGKISGEAYFSNMYQLTNSFILQVIEKALEVGADSSQFPSSWIFHSREKKPGKAFVDGLLSYFVLKIKLSILLVHVTWIVSHCFIHAEISNHLFKRIYLPITFISFLINIVFFFCMHFI